MFNPSDQTDLTDVFLLNFISYLLTPDFLDLRTFMKHCVRAKVKNGNYGSYGDYVPAMPAMKGRFTRPAQFDVCSLY
jgi:hypothetical protein